MDIKTHKEPLRSLISFPQKIAREMESQMTEKASEWLDKVIKGAGRMRRLIEDLSRYSRVVRREHLSVPTDCNVVLAEVCEILEASRQESQAQIVAENLPTIMGNGTQLTLLFQNLIGNALKFREPSRPVVVEVGAQEREDDWLFWVRDNGIGMDERYLEKIFELSERLHPASKYEGTGFGLAICDKIVEGHGGRIWAASEMGSGSTFYFTLPIPAHEPLESASSSGGTYNQALS